MKWWILCGHQGASNIHHCFTLHYSTLYLLCFNWLSPPLLTNSLSKMLPRPKSIFHLGEEGGGEHQEQNKGGVVATKGSMSPSKASRGLEGLRILIQHHGQRSNIVIKPMLKSPKGFQELGFLKACFWCKKELSPHEDVYMYRYISFKALY